MTDAISSHLPTAISQYFQMGSGHLMSVCMMIPSPFGMLLLSSLHLLQHKSLSVLSEL